MNYQSIKRFWDSRAQQYRQKKSLSATNLEEDEKLQELKVKLEKEHVFRLLNLTPEMCVLDLGAGIGAWSFPFADRCREVVGVEYSEGMVSVAREKARESSVTNIEFICLDVLDFCTDRTFDVIFCSGLLLYVPDSELPRLLKNIKHYSKPGTLLFLREAVGMGGRHEIVNKYSEALKAYYNALYRTREEMISLFGHSGFSLLRDEDMFEEGSPLNKWKETRLRVFLFERNGS